MVVAGDIYIGNYQGWYSVRDEAFYAEGETTVGPDNVRVGPQGTPVEWTEEKSYFFRLSAYQDRLLKLYSAHPDFVLPETRFNEVISFVKSGLQDLSISRTTLAWGVPVPDAPDHVICLGRRAHQLLTESAIRILKSPQFSLAGRCTSSAGHRGFPRGLLAGSRLSAVCATQAHLQPRLLSIAGKMSNSVGTVVDPLRFRPMASSVRYFFMRDVPFGQTAITAMRPSSRA